MYAVIATGGKQYRVAEGDVLDVERLPVAPSDTVDLRPVLLVAEDGTVTSDRGALAAARVSAEVLDEHRGKKITVATYRNKTGYRRKHGHRQTYTRIRINAISA